MARFDFVDSAAFGYKFVWQERQMIAFIALFPFVIKLLFLVASEAFGLSENLSLKGLVLLPSYFAEGWLIAHVLRMAFMSEGMTLTGNPQQDFQLLADNRRSVLASTIVYVLINLTLALFMALFMGEVENNPEAQEAGTGALSFIVALMILAFLIWSFRLLWLHVVVALDHQMDEFLLRIRPFNTSFYMIGTWMLCFVPGMVLYLSILNGVETLFPDAESYGAIYGTVFVQTVLEMFLAVVTSVAIGFGIQSLYESAPS